MEQIVADYIEINGATIGYQDFDDSVA